MKQISAALTGFSQYDIRQIEITRSAKLRMDEQDIILGLEDIEIIPEDIPGWTVASSDKLTVALDITLDDALKQEGLARELINRVQNLRKDSGLEVTDRIMLEITASGEMLQTLQDHETYISSETLASIQLHEPDLTGESVQEIELTDGIRVKLRISKVI